MVDENKIFAPYFGAAITKLYIEKLCLFFQKFVIQNFQLLDILIFMDHMINLILKMVILLDHRLKKFYLKNKIHINFW